MTETLEKDVPTIPLADVLGQRYLSYALSTIMSRSLPDVRDGLKPVQRRLLYAMQQLKLDPASGYKKAARVVGDVIGKYHPHGDSSVYDALVRLAQLFSTRYPLVDGQGNFGNIDGDSAAAMRYTEAKLTDVAWAILEDLDKDTVDFDFTYDGEEEEPRVMPSNFPNLLANGSTGIAVGMATSVPPHHAGELCDALLHLIKAPNARIETLVEKIPGPDFPTGGVMLEDKTGILEMYTTGKGSVTVRANWSVEDLDRGQYQIVVTEIPYHVQKGRLIEKTAEMMFHKKLPLIDDVRDESAEDVRIVITPKSRTVAPEVLMETLYMNTEFQSRFPVNLNVLGKDNIPRVMNLRALLQAFLDHRREVLVRKSEFRLAQISRRLEVLSGYLTVFLNLDEVIRIIREEDNPKEVMMARFSLTENQVEAVLNMRLRSLRKLEEIKLKEEYAELEGEEKTLKQLVADESLQWQEISTQVRGMKEKFGNKSVYGPRRTIIQAAPADIDISAAVTVEKEPLTIICSAAGWIRAAKGHSIDSDSLKYKEGDEGRFLLKASTTDKLLMVTSDGKFYTLGCDKLPSARGFGEPLSLMIDMNKGCEVVNMFVYQKGGKLLLASSDGRGFVVNGESVLAQTRTGKQVMSPAQGEKAVVAKYVEEGADMLAVVGSNRKMIIFPLAEVSELNKGRGVILQKFKKGHLSDLKAFPAEAGLTWENGGRAYMQEDISAWCANRAGQGKVAPSHFPKSNSFGIDRPKGESVPVQA